MAEIVNLRRARKVQARKTREKEAATNRAKFGEAKAGRTLRKAEAELAGRAFENQTLDKEQE